MSPGDGERVDWVLGTFYSTFPASLRAERLINGPAVSDFLRAVTGVPDLVWSGSRPLAGRPGTERPSPSPTGSASPAGSAGTTSRKPAPRGSTGSSPTPLDSEGTTSANGVAPRIIASYDVTAATQVNAQVSKGFRLGGINDPLNTPICSPEDLATFGGRGTWEDEQLWNYEAGVKSTFLGGRGTFNASGFYMDVSNLQATVTAGTCSSRIIFNVPDARSAGIELELAAQPTTFFDFAVSASVADARLQSTSTSTDEDGAVSVVSGIEAGKRLPTTPRFQTAATSRWLAGAGWVGYLSGTFQHVGSRFTQVGDQTEGFSAVNLIALSPVLHPGTFIGGPLAQNTFAFNPELPGYNILNARVGFLNGRWDSRRLALRPSARRHQDCRDARPASGPS